MVEKILCEGNEAVGRAAIQGGCRHFFGYTISFELQSAIVMHPQFLAQYQKRVLPGGLLFIDSSVIKKKVSRENVKIFYIPATETAVKLDDGRVANLVLLGTYLEATQAVPLGLVEESLERRLGGKERLLLLNKQALREGSRLMADYREVESGKTL